MSAPEVHEAAGKVMGIVQGGAVLSVLLAAEKTGLLKAMAKAGPLTPKEIALKSGLQERYITEIMSALTAAQIIQHNNGTFLLSDTFADCLVNEGSPFYLGGIMAICPLGFKVLPTILDSVKNGGGVPSSGYGLDLVQGMEKLNGPAYRNFLVSQWLPSFPGLVEKLEKGIRVADIGCGSGLALIIMAKNFPKSQFFGFDLSQDFISRAKENAKTEGVSNVTFECKSAVDLPVSPGFDLILTVDVIHHLVKPLDCLGLIFKALKNDGLYLMVEPKAGNTLEENLQSPMAALMYSISVMYCLPNCLSECGPGYGTLMAPKIAEDLCRQAGFQTFRPVSIDSMINRFFEVRKEATPKLIL